MEVHGAASREQQQQHDGGRVKVKFIETQFVSSDAASFKALLEAAGAPPPPNLEDLHELRDFSDLFYPTSLAGGGRRVDGGGYGYPY
uniref:VQ domain-containing protein n=1 Tax=Oryza punctata TaxID=4537 RepID=A0A0E0LC86_ORYPU